ncbi:glycosyltransferase family A protein [Catenovulum sp. SX2]|uniref:glycosyltransferase family A protein n=1 Tax=Catenovulum sp. SX2 TaxID=3398614 RepID=UPI003F874B1B
MFYFITTVRHPSNATNFDVVLKLLETTVASVCAQKTNKPYKLLVVCNQIPDIKYDPNKVEFLVVDFPPPGSGQSNNLSYSLSRLDKGSKIAAALLHLRKIQPSKVFFIDADDWISNQVVEYVEDNAEVPFWYANSGYLINYSSLTVVKKFGLCRYCGSSFIYDYKILMDILAFPAEFEVKCQKDIVDFLDEFTLINILGTHRYQFKYFLDRGYSFKALPFPSICWVLDTGENRSGKTGGGNGTPLTAALLNNYGVAEQVEGLSEQSSQFSLGSVIESAKSWGGWFFTDKKQFKV